MYNYFITVSTKGRVSLLANRETEAEREGQRRRWAKEEAVGAEVAGKEVAEKEVTGKEVAGKEVAEVAGKYNVVTI